MDIVAFFTSLISFAAVTFLAYRLLKLQDEVEQLRTSLEVTSNNVEEISLALSEWE